MKFVEVAEQMIHASVSKRNEDHSLVGEGRHHRVVSRLLSSTGATEKSRLLESACVVELSFSHLRRANERAHELPRKCALSPKLTQRVDESL